MSSGPWRKKNPGVTVLRKDTTLSFWEGGEGAEHLLVRTGARPDYANGKGSALNLSTQFISGKKGRGEAIASSPDRMGGGAGKKEM